MLYSVKADLTQLVISYCSLKQYLSASNHPKMFFLLNKLSLSFFLLVQKFLTQHLSFRKGIFMSKMHTKRLSTCTCNHKKVLKYRYYPSKQKVQCSVHTSMK